MALVGADGSADWWCVPNLGGAPLFDRLASGDRFSVAPVGPRLDGSVTTLRTGGGVERLTKAGGRSHLALVHAALAVDEGVG